MTPPDEGRTTLGSIQIECEAELLLVNYYNLISRDEIRDDGSMKYFPVKHRAAQFDENVTIYRPFLIRE